MESEPAIVIRMARNEDAADLIRLVGACYSEYPGVVLDVDGEAPELKAVATAFRALGGRFWVVESEGRVVGSVGVVPKENGSGMELRRLYVDASRRRRGIATRLCDLAEASARSAGARWLELWSDTRFLEAHAFYEGFGFHRTGRTRALHDRSQSVEFHYRKSLESAETSVGG